MPWALLAVSGLGSAFLLKRQSAANDKLYNDALDDLEKMEVEVEVRPKCHPGVTCVKVVTANYAGVYRRIRVYSHAEAGCGSDSFLCVCSSNCEEHV